MHDLIFLAYIALRIGLAWTVKRVPFWQLRVIRMGDASFIPDQRPAGCMMLFCLAVGAVIAVCLPLTIADLLPRDPYQFGNRGVQDLDGFGRLATIVGGICGGYVGFRGSRLWAILLVAGTTLYLASSVVRWAVGGF